MGAVKEMWMAAVEELTEQYIEAGMDPEDAQEKAYENAQCRVVDRLADYADNERKRRREEGR